MKRYLAVILVILASFSMRAQEVVMVNDTLTLHIQARKGMSAIMDDPQARAAVAELFAGQRNSDSALEAVLVFGSASPDGLWGNNIALSGKRAENVADYIVAEMDVHTGIVRRTDLREDWGTLYNMVRDSDLQCKEQVLQIISTRTWGDRKTALRSLEGGKVWEQLERDFFPQLRCATVMLVCRKAVQKEEEIVHVEKEVPENADTVQVKEEFVFIKESVPMTAVAPEAVAEKGRKVWDSPWMMGVKTNLASDIITVPSIGVEAQLSRHMSLDISGWYRTDYNGVSPELRWWFGDRTMRQGSFIGVHANVACFDMEWNDAKLYRAEKGDNWSAGMTYGYSLGFGKRDHWGLEFVAGAGYLHSVQDIWEKNDHDEWQLQQHKHMTGFGLTKFGINLTYRFSLRRYEQ